MFKRIFSDWKYILMLVVTVASVAGPFWLWNKDQRSKSMSVSVLSQVALQPKEKGAIQGLQVLIEGRPIEEPYLSVIQLKNDGEKPIITSDFEAPFEVILLSKAKVARARVTEKIPEDIDAKISWDKQSIQLKPLLLNPEDRITISIITSGGAPQLTTKARIAGVSSVPLIDATKVSHNPFMKWLLIVIALLFAIMSAATRPSEAYSSEKLTASLRKRTLRLNSFATGMVAAACVATFLNEMGFESFGYYLLLCIGVFAIAIPFSIILNNIPKDLARQ